MHWPDSATTLSSTAAAWTAGRWAADACWWGARCRVSAEPRRTAHVAGVEAGAGTLRVQRGTATGREPTTGGVARAYVERPEAGVEQSGGDAVRGHSLNIVRIASEQCSGYPD